MSYQALYRKFRPAEFDQVKGQDHIVTTLQNQIKADRMGHAYLFCGTRGTGKTTMAKIFAKAVNCENPVDGSPCGQCRCCKAIAEGSSLNVIEIDAASNNGVDSIRQIREEVEYPPTEGRFKVYIIDEVHMLSAGAFNAMLKTLEEPPEYVIFILATTEVHKIPITILSRCQRYDFRRITLDTIADRLTELMNIEGTNVEPKAIRYVAKAADGSMRDALSLLDRCLAFYLGKDLTYDNVIDVLGAVDTEVYSRLFRALCEDKVKESIAIVDELFVLGREPGQFVVDFTWYLRNLLLVGSDDNMEDVIDMSTENIALLKEESKLASPEKLMRFIEVFSELSNNIRYSAQKRILIEIAIIRLVRPAMDADISSLIQRIEDMENKLEKGVPMIVSEQGAATSAPVMQTSAYKKRELPKAISADVEKSVTNWPQVLANLKEPFLGIMTDAKKTVTENGTLSIVFKDEFTFGMVKRKSEYSDELKDALAKVTGTDIDVEFESVSAGATFDDMYTDIEKAINSGAIGISLGNIVVEEED